MNSGKKLRRAIEVELRSDPVAVFPFSVDVKDGIATEIEHLDLDEDSNVGTRHELRNAPL